MKELAFPIAAIALTFLLLIPALTLLSRSLLALMRAHTRRWVDFGGGTTLVLLIAPTLLPLTWLTSSALHQTESAQALQACLLEHSVLVTACLEVVALLGLVSLSTSLVVAIKARQSRIEITDAALADDHPLMHRLERIIRMDARLKDFSIRVTRQGPAAIFTYGWWRPRLFIDACYLRDNDDEILRAALLHEVAHARARDPLRVFVARICLMLNPAGRLLSADFERWQNAREAICDAEAVQLGGDPLSLAQGIVRAARFQCTGATACGISRLCGHGAALLKLRVALLLDGQHSAPRRRFAPLLLGALLLAAVFMPHIGELGALEQFHLTVERLLFGIPA